MFRDKKLPTAAKVAQYGIGALKKRRTVAIHGLLNFIKVQAIRITPRNLVTAIARTVIS